MLYTTSKNLADYTKKDKARFSGIRLMILSRDGYKCVKCGMTQNEHINQWGKALTINHRDGKGRKSKIPNNRPDNLETLCLKCHGLADCKNKKWLSYYNKLRPSNC